MGTQTSFPAVESSGRVWSPYQLAIFNEFASGSGHVVVEAVAGGAKTSTAIEGLKHIPTGKKTLMLAFNKSTAEELKRRVPPGVEAKTSHAIGYGAIMWAWKSQFARVDVDDKREIKLARKIAPSWDETDRGTLCKLVSFAKAWVASSDKWLDALMREYDCMPVGVSKKELVEKAQELLLASQQPSDTVSFDDMVYLPVVLGLRPKQYDFVIVDELQDLNRAQVELAIMSCRHTGRIFGIGDRFQSIYSWRGADSKSIPNFIERLHAKVMPLSVTYRCPRAVVDHVRHLVPHLEAAPGAAKGMVVETAATKMLAAWEPGDFVISRVNAPLVRLCLTALKCGIPAFVLGRDVGASVRSLVEKYRGGQSITGLLEYLSEWLRSEEERLRAMDKADKIDQRRDLCDVVCALAENARTVESLLGRIDLLFSDDRSTRRITFSSIHRIKGAETKRVWLLNNTLREHASQEENNLVYVACTRAQATLHLVDYPTKVPDL